MEITPDIKKRLELLRDKYAAIGQDLNSYLDGLIFANPLVYWDYIEVDALLSLQKPKTDFPDEKIFIVHAELYFEDENNKKSNGVGIIQSAKNIVPNPKTVHKKVK